MSNVETSDPREAKIRLAAPNMTSAERDALLAAFDSRPTTAVGPALVAFEAAIAARAGTEAAVALVSGTAALHLGLRVLGVVRGDTVLVPTLTHLGSANAIRYVGAVPYFVDSEPHTGNIDPTVLTATIEHLSEAGRKPAAVIAVDAFGNCADYDQIREVCDRFDVPILEDASVAIGATYRRQPAGSFGDLGVFSFNANNLVSAGGGGALVGPAPYIERARALATQACDDIDPSEHTELGYAYRMPNLMAAVGSAQLSRLEELIGRAHEIHHRYLEELSDVAGLHVYTQTGFGRGNGWLTVLGLNERLHPSPSEICTALSVVHSIDARPTWKPLHLQPLFSESEIAGGVVAERFWRQGLCVPSGTTMTDAEQDHVIEALRIAIGADLDPRTMDLEAIQSASRGFRRRQKETSSATSGQSGDHASTG